MRVRARRCKSIADHGQDPIHIGKHIIVPEAQNPKPPPFKEAVASLIPPGMLPLCMLAAIQFNYDPARKAGEIDDIRSDRNLTAELGSVELPCSQPLP